MSQGDAFDQLESFPPRKSCDFCKSSASDPIMLGEIYKMRKLTAHYYCLLMASTLEQRGEDDEGLLGFLYHDIIKHIRFVRNIRCDFCQKKGASIICAKDNCRVRFHYYCGLKQSVCYQFFDSFKAFCREHRPVQKIPPRVFKDVKRNPRCILCFENVKVKDPTTYLWPECCKPSCLLHRQCTQHMASSAGYFFKCPLCTDEKMFRRVMRTHGIFIPDKDAAWEEVPGAYDDLITQTVECHAVDCRCPYGKKADKKVGSWVLKKCKGCGGQAVHKGCLEHGSNVRSWYCSICSSVPGVATPRAKTNRSSYLSVGSPEAIIDIESMDD